MRVAFQTLGCKVNQNDSEALMTLFQEQGHQIVPFNTPAEVYLINSCAVTRSGEQKSRQVARRAKELNPQGIVVVCGCYAQVSPEEVAALAGVDLVVGMAERPRLVELVHDYLQQAKPRVEVSRISSLDQWEQLPLGQFAEKTRATLKIQEGCEDFCSYCIIPYARGKVRSMPLDSVKEWFAKLVAKEYREIVLTGIHLGNYGKDLGLDLNQLLQELLKMEGTFRIRLGSLEPRDLSPDLIETIVGHPRICQYLHIPLQSGSDRILKLMNRNYTLIEYEGLLEQIRSFNHQIGIGTDLIVGFPGEEEADFEVTQNFLRGQSFSRIHTFRYSPRPGTRAVSMPGRVPKKRQETWSTQIRELATRMRQQYAAGFRGQKVTVLFEEDSPEGCSGFAGEYLRVLSRTKQKVDNLLTEVWVQEVQDDLLIVN